MYISKTSLPMIQSAFLPYYSPSFTYAFQFHGIEKNNICAQAVFELVISSLATSYRGHYMKWAALEPVVNLLRSWKSWKKQTFEGSVLQPVEVLCHIRNNFFLIQQMGAFLHFMRKVMSKLAELKSHWQSVMRLTNTTRERDYWTMH